MRGEKTTVQATEQSLLHIERWNRRLSILVWILFAILVVLEIVIAVAYAFGVTLDAGFTTWDYIVKYLITPCAVVFGSVLAAQIFRRAVMRRFSGLAQGRFILVTIVLMISEVIGMHYGISVVYALYVIPIVLSVIYVDRKTLTLIYLLCVAGYFLTFYGYIAVFVSPAYYHHTYMDSLGTVGVLTAVYALSRLVLLRVRELTDAAVAQNLREEELTRKLAQDSLTKLYNHATFYEQLDGLILRYQSEGAGFGLIILDIDNFKAVNDTYGHDTGNIVLLKLVDVLRASIGPQDMAFRYGGEEFAVLTGQTAQVAAIAETIRRAMMEARFAGIPHPITVSLGVCVYDGSFGGRREFFSAADKALYRAKQQGKNQVCVAS